MIANPIDPILDNFFIGNAHGSRTIDLLKDNGIRAIVNVAKDLNDPWFPDILSFKFGIIDGHSSENNYFLYQQAAETILFLMDNEVPTLLHCHEGISRSGAVGALVVASRLGIKLGEAVVFLQTKRPAIFINNGHISLVDTAWYMMKKKRSLAPCRPVAN